MSTGRDGFLENFGPLKSHAARCIRCGYCNAVCPTSNVTSSFKESRTSRGRMILLQSLVDDLGNVRPYSSDFKALIDLCYSCRRCVSVCPAGIPIPDLMSHARDAYLRGEGNVPLTLGHKIFANYGTLDRIAALVAPLSNWMLQRHLIREFMQWTTHIDSRAQLPKFQRGSFQSWAKKQPKLARPKKIVYFVDSYANYNDPRLGKLVFALLDHMNYEVIVPPQKESGMPAVEYGMFDKARSLARYNLEHLSPYAQSGTRIVCSSLAASYLFREGYKSFLNDDALPHVSAAIVDIAELLLEEYDQGNITFTDGPEEKTLYHCCCLSRTLSLGPITTRLLDAAKIQYEQIDDCCGGAGVWGTFKENYDISAEIAGKLGKKLKSGVTVITESETCRLQMESRTGASVLFPIELLAAKIPGLRDTWSERHD